MGCLFFLVGRKHTSMVGFHPLQRVHKKSSASKIICFLLRCDSSLYRATRPESMSHRSPRLLRICTEERGPILAYHQTGSLPCESQVHEAVIIDCGFNSVRGAFVVQGKSKIICAKGIHIRIKHHVVKCIGVPDMRGIAGDGVNLRVE